MTDIPILPQDEDNLLAAEYVMGLLDLAERTAVEIRLRNDTAFAATVPAKLEDRPDYTPSSSRRGG